MATSTINYTGPTTITFSPASVASSSTFIAGRESTEVNNTSNLYTDALVQGFVTTHSTAPTVDKQIRIYVWGSNISLGTTALDVLDGTDSTETFTSVEIRDTILIRARTIVINASTSQKYHIKPFSVAQMFGEMPQFWGLFLAQNTEQILSATGADHEFKYTGIKFDSA